jgi:hypothetical protein
MARGQGDLKSYLGLLFTLPVLIVSAIYTYGRLQILIGRGETSINVTDDSYAPFYDFDFTSGRESSGEGFKFQFIWNVYDPIALSPPPDLERVG